jgi:hypothetical protein
MSLEHNPARCDRGAQHSQILRGARPGAGDTL